MRSVHVPHLGLSMKLGRVRPANRMRLHLRDYLRAVALPAPPSSVDYSSLAKSALAQIYKNDVWGDCVIAGIMHLIGVWTGNANNGSPFIATDAQVQDAYTKIGGFDPNNPTATDQGCDEVTALNFCQQTGVGDGVKFSGWTAVDGTNQTEIQQAVSLFEGGLMFGIALPDAWISPFPSASGFVWDVAGDPNPNNGHCIVGVGYTAQGVLISTWGLIGTITWAAIAKYATQSGGGELYTALSPDQVAAGQAKAPNGVAWDDLLGDFNAIAGAQPLPAPGPNTPPATLTLVQAQQAAAQGLANAWPVGAP